MNTRIWLVKLPIDSKAESIDGFLAKNKTICAFKRSKAIEQRHIHNGKIRKIM